MYISDNYSLQKICAKSVLIPKGQSAIDGAKILTLNDTAKWIVEEIMNGDSKANICKKANDYYEFSPEDTEKIDQSICLFIEKHIENKLVAE